MVAILVVLLLPIFGTGLIINVVFYTQDHHVLYDLVKQKLTCGNLNLKFDLDAPPEQQKKPDEEDEFLSQK